jgi:predicted small lipoprotein YifL
MKKIILSLLVIFTLSLAVTSCEKEKKETPKTEETTAVYQCPMDCEKGKTYDKPGSCPVCKMDLKPVKEKAKEDHSGHNH